MNLCREYNKAKKYLMIGSFTSFLVSVCFLPHPYSHSADNNDDITFLLPSLHTYFPLISSHRKNIFIVWSYDAATENICDVTWLAVLCRVLPCSACRELQVRKELGL